MTGEVKVTIEILNDRIDRIRYQQDYVTQGSNLVLRHPNWFHRLITRIYLNLMGFGLS